MNRDIGTKLMSSIITHSEQRVKIREKREKSNLHDFFSKMNFLELKSLVVSQNEGIGYGGILNLRRHEIGREGSAKCLLY